jgi:hypothetical protein
MLDKSPDQKSKPAPAAAAALRPIYLLVVFWGEEHRNYVANLLIPSLLAPGNLPAIAAVEGSKLVLCTTRADWDVLQAAPLFKETQKYIDPLWIEIDFPKPGDNKYLHSAHTLKRAVQKCWTDGACASFLVPDLILSDGMLGRLRDLAASGMTAVLAPAFRFDLDGCMRALTQRGLVQPGRPIVASARELAAIATQNLHSELHRFEWDAPHFCRQPISVWWRLPGNAGVVFHTTSWAMALVNFHALSALNDSSLDYTTHDGVFIDENFFRFQRDGTLHLMQDSDEALLFPLTSERDITYYPLQALALNRLPILGKLVKFWHLKIFLAGATFDPFRRWAVTRPVFIHGGPLTDACHAKAAATAALMRRATRPPGRVLKLYSELPTWTLLRSYARLLIDDPAQFLIKSWRRVSGTRRA